MKHKGYFILLALTGVILFSLPFLFKTDVNEKIDAGVTLLSGFATILTLIIALLLFNKFGIEKTYLDKQTQQVFDLLEKLNQPIITISGVGTYMRLWPTQTRADYYKPYYETKLIFSTKYMKGLEDVFGHCDNIFLPKIIATKLRALRILGITGDKNKNLDSYLIISVPLKDDHAEGMGQPFQWDKELTLLEFMNLWSDLIEEIKAWIEQNSSIKSDLNL